MNQDNQQVLIPKPDLSRKSIDVLTHSTNKSGYIYDLPDINKVNDSVMCRLLTVSAICIVFLAAEVVGGIIAQSLAILSDAAHLFSDMSGFFISIFSIWLGRRPASEMMSFGYHRAEVIGALGSIILIWGLTMLLFYEATMRIIDKSIVKDPLIMVITAGFGLFCNIVMAKVLHSAPGGNSNIMHAGCDHDHGDGGHEHHHDHDGHSHNHSHSNKQSSSSPSKSPKQNKKRKLKVHEKRSRVKSGGISLLIVESQFDSVSSGTPIIEDSHESDVSSNHNHSQNCHHDKDKKNQPQQPDHFHSSNCLKCDNTIKDELKTEKNEKQVNGAKKNHSNEPSDHENNGNDSHDHQGHDHDHDHEHDHDDHNHDHDHDHDHNHDHHNHDHQKKKSKIEDSSKQAKNKSKSKNLSEYKESDNYNLRAAMIHIIGDIIQSIGVLIAALIIYFFGRQYDKNGDIIFTNYQYADPVCTYLFSVLVMFTTFGVAKECLKVLMEGTPTGLIYKDFSDNLSNIRYVEQVHDLHIWSLSVGKPAMSAHIVCSENQEYVLKKATKLCRQFGIYHSTIQIEQIDRQGQKDYIKCNHNIHK